MRAFLWDFDDDERLVDREHGGGALLIIAESVVEAERMWREAAGKDIYGQTSGPLTELIVPKEIPAPFRTWQVDPYSKSEMFIFPNHGCC